MNEKAQYEISLKDGFSPVLNKASSNLDGFEKKISGLAGGLGIALSGTAILGGISKISALGGAAEQTRISFEVLLGSVGKGNALLGELKNYANVTPYLSKDILDSSKMLLSFGIDAKKIMPTIKMIGDVASGDAGKMQSLSLAFGQMSSAGRLMGQDLLQMINAGFNPLQVISQKTGMSMAILKKKMEQGAISTKMVESAFKAATEQGGLFYHMTERQSETFEGKLSTLRDKMEIWGTDVGTKLNNAFSPVLSQVTSWMDQITDKAGSIKSESSNEVSRIRSLVTETLPLIDRFEKLKDKGQFGRTAKETHEYIDTFEKLAKELPAASVFDSKGNKANFSVDAGRKFIEEQTKKFNRETDTKLFALGKELSSIDRKIGINKSELVLNKTSKFGSKDKEISLQDALAEKNRERNRLLGLIDETKSERNNAFLKLPSYNNSSADPFVDLAKDTSKKKKSDEVDGSVRSGGVKNITINIQQLAEVNFAALNEVTEKEAVRIVKMALLTAVNDANLALN